MMSEDNPETLLETPLTALNRELGGRIVPFAGYAMPVQFDGIMAEHNWTRQKAGLFDVSHMGQRFLVGPDHATSVAALETLTPGSFANLKPGAMRYTILLNDDGGIVDDLIVTRPNADKDDGRLMLVVNGARKHVDDAYIRDRLPAGVSLEASDDRALVALQGPSAAEALGRVCPKAATLTFMTATGAEFTLAGGEPIDCHVSRSGYTGEDGYEISVHADHAEALVKTLLADDDVRPVGLGARDSLRLEAGLPLYGQDLDETTSPVEASLLFAIAKSRRETGGFPGAERIMRELQNGPARIRVGLRPEGRAPVREGADVLSETGEVIGKVTSGGFGPTVGGPVAMGYIDANYPLSGPDVQLSGRRGPEPAQIAKLPFTPHNYVRS
jgi:aminomethyltransferase